jgi:4-aminobutyrate aminotransferase-like enzyme
MDIVKKALAQKLVINCTSERVLRIMPPLVIDAETAHKGLDILERLLKEEASS